MPKVISFGMSHREQGLQLAQNSFYVSNQSRSLEEISVCVCGSGAGCPEALVQVKQSREKGRIMKRFQPPHFPGILIPY